MTAQHYDVIIIGTGAGGGTLAYRLAFSGKKILILERGTFLPIEKENWSALEVYQRERYHTQERWYDTNGKTFRPATGYWVGGNTKVYGAALLRLRERDFEQVEHKEGISPEWALKYRDFEPYYDRAEELYDVHGQSRIDPTEPPRSLPYPYPAVRHEPGMQELANLLTQVGLHPFNLPLGLKLNEVDRSLENCIRCNTCDGFPCLTRGKADAEVNCIQPIRDRTNVTLLVAAKVTRLHTSPSGREIARVEAEIDGQHQFFTGDIVVVACGAINSAALLLRSRNDRHPSGLANSSGQVGRNLMKHNCTAMVQLSTKLNSDVYQKTICISDFYWGELSFPYPMGLVQNTGNVLADMLPAEAPALLAPLLKLRPGAELKAIADRSVGWWLQTEDLPDPDNRVRVEGDRLYLEYKPNNTEAASRLIQRWATVLKQVDRAEHFIPFSLYPRNTIPLQAVGHQCGTCRFGEDPTTSVLDLNCRTHEINNLYVVDGSFFPSSAAVNPTLTIVANALRVGDYLMKQLM
ncbi:MAG: 6'''-hydroxyparomomycin C oxidase [Chroococcidiopsis sp. SAG 2025]|uniref:GMC family oxidoreductase n=1 Tax=Chroococcidiopsis sp. SAG 2025 TaxID=171389 RepID=UPI0029374697|nr:GMC family oxidoreductase [Chroococcidiopsis sp. SAG 2025]MDV2994700.1 6'''-hydroxyparomomycin C oxidase [Chroococcidiopsis sp. SAG 2025]